LASQIDIYSRLRPLACSASTLSGERFGFCRGMRNLSPLIGRFSPLTGQRACFATINNLKPPHAPQRFFYRRPTRIPRSIFRDPNHCHIRRSAQNKHPSKKKGFFLASNHAKQYPTMSSQTWTQKFQLPWKCPASGCKRGPCATVNALKQHLLSNTHRQSAKLALNSSNISQSTRWILSQTLSLTQEAIKAIDKDAVQHNQVAVNSPPQSSSSIPSPQPGTYQGPASNPSSTFASICSPQPFTPWQASAQTSSSSSSSGSLPTPPL
jgi:hypothetical protein